MAPPPEHEPESRPLIDAAAFDRMLRERVPAAARFGCTTEAMRRGYARLRLPFDPMTLRPGDTVSGPTIFTLADTALYAALLSEIGMEPLALTADMHIRFLRRAGRADLVAEARLFRCGKRLATGEVHVRRANDGALIAHATGAYARP